MTIKNKVINFNLPIKKRPFKKIAEDYKIKEEELISLLNTYKEKGIIRKFGAVLDPRKLGFKINALVCWKIKKNKIFVFGKYLSSFSQVSHCYFRKSFKNWPYNIYTMFHCYTKKEFFSLIEKILKYKGVEKIRILFTQKEFKKTRFVLK